MQFSMTGHKRLPLNTDDCLVEVTTWAGLAFVFNPIHHSPFFLVSIKIQLRLYMFSEIVQPFECSIVVKKDESQS
jgi:hypothetical protein